MYIILKDNENAQRVAQKIAKLDPAIMVNRTSVNVIIKAPNIVSTVQVLERSVKAWKKGEPNKPFFIHFQNIISILEL
jgi:hypothetical protein